MQHSPASRSSIPHVVAAGLACAVLAACSSGPQVDSGPTGQPDGGAWPAGRDGGDWPDAVGDRYRAAGLRGGPLQVAGTASNATAWLGASFRPVEPGAADLAARRVVYRFDGTAAGSGRRSAPAPPPAPGCRRRRHA